MENLSGAFQDAAFGVALAIASLSVVSNLVLCVIAFWGGIPGNHSRTIENAFTSLLLAFGSYVIAVVLWRVLKLPKL